MSLQSLPNNANSAEKKTSDETAMCKIVIPEKKQRNDN